MTAPADVLPASLEEAERNAERIAALARAGAAAIVGLAVSVAMAIVPDDTRAYVLPRLYTALAIMACFVVVAALSYYASRRQTYRHWYAHAFAVADVGLIGVALLSGVMTAGHPGPYVFAQPAVWLIPIMLAIQAVRFRDGPLISSAALFVTVLVGFLLVQRPPTAAMAPSDTLTMIFDVPPAVVRIIMLAVASAVLVYAVRAKRDILARGIGTARREAELNRFLPAEVSRTLAAQSTAPAAQRELAVLFIDLVGFTRAAEQARPVDVAGWLAAYRERVGNVVRQHGGFIDKFIGDGVMAIFGYESDAAGAAHAAMTAIPALGETMADWRRADPGMPSFEVAVGGALGPVFVGVIGAGERREFTVIGDAVNVAARLEAIAKEHRALAAVSRDLVFAGAATGLSELGPVELRGRDSSVEVCLVPRRTTARDGG